jgi:dynactin complex subunit
LQFPFAIAGTSAATYRVFSITNALWTDEKSRFLVETIKTVIVTKTHFEEISCNDFYTLISNNPKLQDNCPKGKNNSFNINWKLTSNKIL